MRYIIEIEKKFRAHENEAQATQMAAYLKNHFKFMGIKSPERNAIIKEHIKQFGLPSVDQIENLTIGLWSLPEREYQYTGMELAAKVLKKPEPAHIHIIEYMLSYNQWWDTVDFIAVNLVGEIFSLHDEIRSDYINKWLNGKDMWLNRSVLLFQLKYKDKTDNQILSNAILKLKDSKEFFIQKAIGWSLRQYSKYNKDWVKSFLQKHELPKLSVREASKYM